MGWERERQAVWKVGLFVAMGIAVVSVLIFALQDWRVLRSGYELRLRFETAGGLLVGAPVKYAGVEVGEVIAIRYLPRSPEGRHAEVVIRLPQGLEIRSDDEVWIGMLGLLGEKYVEILPGPGRGRLLEPGEVLPGAGAISELALAREASAALGQARRTLESAQTLLEEAKFLERFQATAERMDALANRAEKTAQRVEALLDTWEAVGQEVQETLEGVRGWGPWLLLGAGLGLGVVLLLGML